MTNAVVLVKAQTDRVAELAQAIADLRGVKEVYSVAGQFDLVVLVAVRENEELADLISGRIRKLSGIVATETLIAFKVYSRRELESGSDLGIE
jgi:DNA-binding Lrp family transcriptional regulator